MGYQIEANRLFKVDHKNHLMSEVHFIPISNQMINIDRVFVDPAYRGQGLAQDIMKDAYDYFKKKDIRIQASCSFAKKWLEENIDKKEMV